MSWVASLPMYDRPALREATDALYSALATRLRALGLAGVPAALSRPADHTTAWKDPRLLFSQSCGYDVIGPFRGRLLPVAVPHPAAEGCARGRYRSALVVRADDKAEAVADLKGRRAAYNQDTSHSGRVALANLVAPLSEQGRFFGSTLATGSHEKSAEAVADGAADVASLDCLSLALLQDGRPDLGRRLRVLAFTKACPAPPYVVGPEVDEEQARAIGEALTAIGEDPALAEVHRVLRIARIEPTTLEAYGEVDKLLAEAARYGYDLLEDR